MNFCLSVYGCGFCIFVLQGHGGVKSLMETFMGLGLNEPKCTVRLTNMSGFSIHKH